MFSPRCVNTEPMPVEANACAAPRASSTFSPGMNRFTVRRMKPYRGAFSRSQALCEAISSERLIKPIVSSSPGNLLRRGERLNQPIVKIHAGIKGGRANTLVPAMRAIVIHIHEHSRYSVGCISGGARNSSVARSGIEHWQNWNAGPHLVDHFFDRVHHFWLKC